jgi:hypothetical protein
MATPRLKACPSCRSTDVAFLTWGPQSETVTCNNCDFTNRPDRPTREDAAAAWNDRGPPRRRK